MCWQHFPMPALPPPPPDVLQVMFLWWNENDFVRKWNTAKETTPFFPAPSPNVLSTALAHLQQNKQSGAEVNKRARKKAEENKKRKGEAQQKTPKQGTWKRPYPEYNAANTGGYYCGPTNIPRALSHSKTDSARISTPHPHLVEVFGDNTAVSCAQSTPARK